MVYGLKLLLPVLVLWVIALFALRALFGRMVTRKDFDLAFRVVLLFTVVDFLSIKPVLFLAISAGAMLISQSWLGGDVKAKLATFWMAAILFPPLQSALPGLGGIAHVLTLDHFRVASIILLVPAALTIASSKDKRKGPSRTLDVLVLSYPVFRMLLLVPSVSLTSTMRSVIELMFDVALPYYVMTRGLRDLEELRFVLHRLLVACMFAATIAFMEAGLRKNIYADLQWVYGYTWSLTHTLMRGGMNRVQAMTSEPIVYATQILFTMGLWVAMAGTSVRKGVVWLGVIALAGAMFFTWSRGPWLGAVLFVLSLFALARVKPWVFGSLLVVAVVAGVFAKLAGLDESVMAALKGLFGSSQEDAGSIQYRSQLLDTALALIKQSPWLGVPNYAAYMQDLKQGEGIIDIVNTYVSVALNTGVVGLVMFLSPFAYTVQRILKDLAKPESAADLDRVRFLRAFLALIVGSLLTIFTTSIFERLPFLLLLMVVAPALWMSFKPVRSPTPASVGRNGRRLIAAYPLNLHGHDLVSQS